MDKGILIVKNITREGPGLLEEILKEHGLEYDIVDISLGQNCRSLKNYGAIIVLGGPDSANDKTPEMKKEIALITEVLEVDIPYLGICLGLQILVKAAGGKVIKSQTQEVGFRDQDGIFFTVELTEDGKRDELFKGLDNSFNVFQLHGETVVLTENMKLLATGKLCRNQVVKTGSKAYGIQCHFELTPEMFEKWINEDPDLLKIEKAKLRTDFSILQEEYTKAGTQIFRNFLKIAGFL